MDDGCSMSYENLASKIESILPSGLVKRIKTKFAWFTAADWYRFTTEASTYAFTGDADESVVRIIRPLSQAIELLLRRTITEVEVQQGHGLMKIALQLFCAKYPGVEVPNFHLALHLQDDIRNFGPAPVYWAFSFERKNGVEGKQENNGHESQIAITAMKKIDETAQSLSSKPSSGSEYGYTGKPKDINVDKLDLPRLKSSLQGVEIQRVCEVRTGVTSWKDKVKIGDIIETEEKKHHKVTKVLLVNNTMPILETQLFELRVLSGADAKCGPVYRRLSNTKNYIKLISYRYKLKLLSKGPNFLLLPGRRRICH